MQAYKEMTASGIAAAVAGGEVKAREVTEQALALAKSEGKELNAFITVCDEKALAQADAIDRLSSEEKAQRPLCGVPVAIKDNISYRDYPMTCGSRILERYVPPYDATVVTKLIAAGAVIIGKTNMDEFAMGSSSETSYFGPVKNPLNHTRTPGGSSGGSAAAVAQGIMPIAYGSETGGSVRQPAAFCGILGLKPTYGGVSRYGLAAFASSTDQISPFARAVEDMALAYSVICGHDEREATSAAAEHPDYLQSITATERLRVGEIAECFPEGMDKAIVDNVRTAQEHLAKAGYFVREVSVPSIKYAVAAYYVIAPAEASANLARYDGVRYGLREDDDKTLQEMYSGTRAAGFGREVKRRIMIGTYVLSAGYYDAYYRKATEVRALIGQEFDRAFEQVDLLVSPTTPTAAFRLGEKLENPLDMYLADCFTIPACLCGLPSISVPFGTTDDGLPTAVQLTARPFEEGRLLQAARDLLSEQE